MSASTAEIVLFNQTLRWSAASIFNDYAELQRIPTFEPTLTESLERLFCIVTSIVYGRQEKTIDMNRLTEPVRQLVDMGRLEAAKDGATESRVKSAISTRFKNPHLIEDTYANEIRAKIDSFASRLRILCLTTKATNAPLWAHYGDRHTGCALEFQAGAIADCFFTEAKRVRYTDNLHAGPGLDILLYGGTDEQLEASKNNIFYAKTTDWSYEDEWRLQYLLQQPSSGDHDDFRYQPQQLAGIYFGLHCTEQFQKKLIANLPSVMKQTPMYKMEQIKGVLQPRLMEDVV